MPSSVWERGECGTPAGCTRLRGIHCGNEGGIPGPFCFKRSTVGQVVAFCQQVKNSLQGSHVHNRSCHSTEGFGSVCSAGLRATGQVGRGDAASIVCAVLYSGGLTVALYPPLACSFTPLFLSSSYLMQFADNLSNSLRGRGSLGAGEGRTAASPLLLSLTGLSPGLSVCSMGWGAKGWTWRGVPERGVLPSATGQSPPAREGNPSLREGSEW